MKLFYLLQKAWLQQSRDILSLVILIATIPTLFMVYYYLTIGSNLNFLPILILLSVIMVIFSSSIIVAREFESKSIIRMIMADVPFSLAIISLCLVQFLLSILSILVTFFLFHIFSIFSVSALGKMFIFACINTLTSIWIGASIGSLAKNTFSSFSIASLIMFLLLFLSGSFFPVPRIELFLIGSYAISLADFIPSNSFLRIIVNIKNKDLSNMDALVFINIFNSFLYLGITIILFQISKLRKVNDES